MRAQEAKDKMGLGDAADSDEEEGKEETT